MSNPSRAGTTHQTLLILKVTYIAILLQLLPSLIHVLTIAIFDSDTLKVPPRLYKTASVSKLSSSRL